MASIPIIEHPLLRKVDVETLESIYMHQDSPYDLRCPYIDPSFVQEHSSYGELMERHRAPFRSPFIFHLEGLEDRRDTVVLSNYNIDIQVPVPQETENAEPQVMKLKDMCILYVHNGYVFLDYVDVALYLARLNCVTPKVYISSPTIIHKDLRKTHPEEFPDFIPGKWYFENIVKPQGKGHAIWLYLTAIDISFHIFFRNRMVLA